MVCITRKHLKALIERIEELEFNVMQCEANMKDLLRKIQANEASVSEIKKKNSALEKKQVESEKLEAMVKEKLDEAIQYSKEKQKSDFEKTKKLYSALASQEVVKD